MFLFDSNYVCDIIKHPGGVADLLGRFCTQFFLYAWVGAVIIGILLSAIQLLVSRFVGGGWFYGLSYVPSFLLWLFLLDEHALLGGVWAVLLTLLAVWGLSKLPKGWVRYIAVIVVLPILYWMVGSYWLKDSKGLVIPLCSFALVAVVMGAVVWKNANFKAEKVMQYDFMASHQQWNRIIETANKEKPNNQIGVTVQNLALAMRGVLLDQMQNYNQNGIAGLLPDVQSDATSPMPTAEAFYQLGMINVAQRTVFEAQEAILDFQKSGRCYKRLAQTNLINGNYEVARKYLMALQKTLFYSDWANETLSLLGDEVAIAKHPEYGRLRKWAYKDNFFFSDHVTPEMLESLYSGCTDNSMAYQYLIAYYMLTGDRERYNNFISKNR